MKALVKVARWALPLLGFTPMAAGAAGPISPSAAPVSWVQYAENVTAAITQWLEGEDQDATDLRDSLVAEDRLVDQAQSSLVLSLWIDGTRLSRVDFPTLGDAQMDGHLRAFLTGRHFGAAPPPNMQQPMRVVVDLRREQD